MPRFIVDTTPQPGGEHLVHDAAIGRGCHPRPEQQLSLGVHSGCRSAVVVARSRFGGAIGCAFCVPLCAFR